MNSRAWKLLKKERLFLVGLGIILTYSAVALLAKFGMIASPWDQMVGKAYEAPSFADYRLWFGTDYLGRSVLFKTIHGTRIAMSVGFVTCLISTPVGVVLGALAGYFGKWVDDGVVWFYTTLSSVPNIMLLMAIAYVMGRGIFGIYAALSVTAWVGLARVIRGEFMKHKTREYVVAAQGLGASHFSRIFRHILPNVFHFVIINFSIQFVAAIKSEVILSFLGLGVQGQPSWGVMIDDSKLELARGVWWQLAGATLGMLFIVLAFNVVGDALRDALDPRIK